MMTTKFLLTISVLFSTIVSGQTSKQQEVYSGKNNLSTHSINSVKQEVLDMNLSNNQSRSIKRFNLDSIVSYNNPNRQKLIRNVKTRYTYTDDLLTQTIDYKFDKSANSFERDRNIEYRYNNNRLVSRKTEYDWNSTYWQRRGKFEFTYDQWDNIILEYIQVGNSSNNWVDGEKNIAKYDSLGNQTYKENLIWNSANNIWIGWEKYEHQYNSDGTLNQSIYYNWRSDNSGWIVYKKGNFTYTPTGILVSSLYQIWDASTNSFVNSNVGTVTLDSLERETQVTLLQWNKTDSIWLKMTKTVTGYDTIGNKNLIIRYNAYKPTNTWREISKQTAIYNGTRYTLRKTFSWDTTATSWNIFSKSENTINTIGDLTLNMEYTDSISTGWRNISKDERQYDLNHNQILSLGHYWDMASQSFLKGNKWVKLYDSRNNKTLSESYSYDQTLQAYRGTQKIDQVFNSKDQITSTLYFGWDITLQQWVNSVKFDLEIDSIVGFERYNYWTWDTINLEWDSNGIRQTDFDLSTTVKEVNTVQNNPLKTFGNNAFIINRILETRLNKATGNIYTLNQGLFYYSPIIPASVNEMNDNRISIVQYPNPVTDIIYFKDLPSNNTQIEIFDLQGKRILKTQLSNSNGVSVSFFPSGVYIYQLTHNKMVINGKFTKL